MTHPSNLSKIRKACIAANPEIMELKPGCIFEWTNEDLSKTQYQVAIAYGTLDVLSGKKGLSIYAYDIEPLNSPKMPHPKMICFDDPEDYEDGESFYTFAKILGRDIRLADVLLAIEESHHKLRDDYPVGKKLIDLGITDSKTEKWTIGDIVLQLWNLLKDTLDDQSEETVAFIASLLPE